jgi:hypothetical protein
MIGKGAAAVSMPEKERVVAEVGVGESKTTESGGRRLIDFADSNSGIEPGLK